MTIVVEDGTGLDDAVSYASVDDCAAYCTARGLSFGTSPTVTGEQALVRATAAVDATYGGRFSGYKLRGREQSLQWPRAEAYDTAGILVSSDEVPDEVFRATCEAAVRELATPGSVLPDLERAVQSVKAGSVAVTFAANAASSTTFQLIEGILAPLLVTGSGNGLFGAAVRG